MMTAMHRLVHECVRHQQPMSVLMLDLDHFKRVNDEHGHATGDRVIQAVSTAMRSHVREEDIVARYGGEEFVVLCPRTNAQQATLVAERLRVAIAGLAQVELGIPGPQTISIGVASPGELSPDACESLLPVADAALYAAKAAGRNRVILQSTSEQSEHAA